MKLDPGLVFIKCPARELVSIQGRGKREREGMLVPPAPSFSVAYSSATTWVTPFKFSTCMQ